MLNQNLIPRSEIPPGDFTFTCPDTGYVVSKRNVGEMFDSIERHYNANNLVLVDNWKEIVITRICQKLPPGWCKFEDGSQPNNSPCMVDADAIIRGVESLVHLVWDKIWGKPIYVLKGEAERRAEICSKCHFNVDSRTCLGCGAMAGVIATAAKVKGDRKTKWDHLLKNCCKCGCRNDAIVHIDLEILITGENNETISRYPAWCWKRNVDEPFVTNTISI